MASPNSTSRSIASGTFGDIEEGTALVTNADADDGADIIITPASPTATSEASDSEFNAFLAIVRSDNNNAAPASRGRSASIKDTSTASPSSSETTPTPPPPPQTTRPRTPSLEWIESKSNRNSNKYHWSTVNVKGTLDHSNSASSKFSKSDASGNDDDDCFVENKNGTNGDVAATRDSHGQQNNDNDDEEHATQNTHHHHAASPPTTVSIIASSIVCFIIYFVFCIVFSSVVWDPLNSADDTTIDPPFGVPQGVGINLMGIAVGSIFFAYKSGCRGIIAGTDLLPVVFFAEAGASVYMYLYTEWFNDTCAHLVDEHIEKMSFGGPAVHVRELLGGATATSADPCFDAINVFLHGVGNTANRERGLAEVRMHPTSEFVPYVVPTTLVAMMIGNAITGLVFYGLGKMKNTASVIGFIPASVVAGFLTCIGYKVIKLAVLITTGWSFKERYIRELGRDLWHSNDPWLPLLIAIIYGCLLYGLKRLHVVSAEKLILGFIFVPIVLFFAIVGISGVEMQRLRDTDWFLTQSRDGDGCVGACAFTRVNFWQTLQVAYGSGDLVAWGAVPRCIPIFIMGAVMTSLDNMLKLTSSEKALGVDLDYNHEMKLGGKGTMLSSILAGTPVYGQTKFNVINLSIARTSDSPWPTLLLGAWSLLLFLTGVAGPIINIMPRFLLGGLCVFAGVGFLYENLWEGRKNMNRVSFAIIWVIFLVNFIWEFFVLQNLPPEIQPMVPGLLVVFILGIVLSTFEFMFAFMHKAKPPVIKGGAECCSSAIRSEKHDNQLAAMAPWFAVFSIESFVFFGTANTMYQQLKKHITDQKLEVPKAERTKYLIFDLVEVTGIDSSAKNVFFKVHRLLKKEGIKLVWAIQKPKLVSKFEQWGLYADGAKQYTSLDLALRQVEEQLLKRAHHLSQKWLVNDTVRRIFERQVLANVFNISVRSDEKNFSSARLQRWCERVTVAAGEELCGEDDDNLYLLYSGEIQISGRDGSHYSVFTGSFFNIDRLLIAVGALPGFPSTLGAVATTESMVLIISRKQFLAMSKDDGPLAQKLLITLIVQNESNRPGRVRVRHVRNENQVPMTKYLDDSRKSQASDTNLGAMASRLLAGDDYEISLTDAQIESFGQVFDLILDPGQDEVPMDRFASYVCLEAKSLGSQIENKQIREMIDASGIDEDGDGSLSKEEFLHFLSGLFLSKIPSCEIDTLRNAYESAVAEAPDEPMDETRVQKLFDRLGFDVESPGWVDVMGVIDADGDGDVDFSEFLTGIGMMKKFYIQSRQLDSAFKHYKKRASEMRGSTHLSSHGPGVSMASKSKSQRPGLSAALASMKSQRFLSKPQAKAPSVEDSWDSIKGGGVDLDASDLEAFLSISRDYAEEMVFLADEDEAEIVLGANEEVTANRTIDRDEFQHLLRSWS